MAEAPEGGGQVIDLMEALRASLEKKTPARHTGDTAAREAQAKPRPAAEPLAAEATPAAGRKPPKRAQAAEGTAKKSAKK